MNKNGIPLIKTTILQEFVRRMLIKNGLENIVEDFIKDTKLIGRCECIDHKDRNDENYIHCATLYFKTNPKYKEVVDCQGLGSSKGARGIIHLYFYKKNLFEIEALLHPSFPFEKEVKRVLNGDFSEPSKAEFKELDKFFKIYDK
jgi:hypothetical protein